MALEQASSGCTTRKHECNCYSRPASQRTSNTTTTAKGLYKSKAPLNPVRAGQCDGEHGAERPAGVPATAPVRLSTTNSVYRLCVPTEFREPRHIDSSIERNACIAVNTLVLAFDEFLKGCSLRSVITSASCSACSPVPSSRRTETLRMACMGWLMLATVG